MRALRLSPGLSPGLFPGLTLSALVLTACFGNAVTNGDDDHGSSGGSAPSGGSSTGGSGIGGSSTGGSASGGSSSGGSATGGSGDTPEAVFACGCLEGSDVGITLTLAEGGEIVFAEPPRFFDPDSLSGDTGALDCENAETPIYFDAHCVSNDVLEACHAEEGCLQIKNTTFVWLSPDGTVLQSGAATLDEDPISWVVNISLDAVSGTLGDSAAPLGTFSGQVCRLKNDACLK